MAAVHLTGKLTPWFVDAFERAADGEEFMWDIAPFPHPQYGLSVVVGVIATGAVLGSIVGSSLTLHAPHSITQEVVDGVARQLVEELRKERTAQLEALPDDLRANGKG